MQRTMKHEHESKKRERESTSSRIWSDLRNDMTDVDLSMMHAK